jgi:hypothetical protein
VQQNGSGVSNTNLGIHVLFLGANLGILPILYDVKRRSKEHVIERPGS